MPKAGRISIGFVSGPHGIKGEIRINPNLTGNLDPRDIREVFITMNDGSEATSRIKGLREGPKGWILKLDGVNSRNDADKYRGAEIEISRDILPPIEDDEFYIDDLIGLKVVTTNGDIVGEVTGIIPTPGQDVLVIAGERGEVLAPAVEPILVEVDLESGVITIDPPEGLLELATK